ncbi:MAG TPA: Wzz/FepE/Etk N-terminal domain-containing protein, partial [Nitrospirota bacterium]
MTEASHDEEISLLDYGNVLWRRKKIVLALFAVSVVIAAVVSLQLPKYYKSETVIIASSSESGSLGAALSSIPMAGALAGTLGVSGLSTPADKMLVFLKSRTIAEMVIKRFDLIHVFYRSKWDAAKGAWKDTEDPPVMEDAVKYLARKIADFKKDKNGTVSIIVEWKDPRLAAEMANYYVAALTEIMKEKSI